MSINSDKDLTNYGLLTLNYETKMSMENETIIQIVSRHIEEYNLLINTVKYIRTNLSKLDDKIKTQIINYNSIIVNDVNSIETDKEDNESILRSILDLATNNYNKIYEEWTTVSNKINNMNNSKHIQLEYRRFADSMIRKLDDKIKLTNLFEKYKEKVIKIEKFTFLTLQDYKDDVEKIAKELLENELIDYNKIKELLINVKESSLNIIDS